MDWSRSYTATWRVFRVNRDTWADGEQITGVDSVSISRTSDGSLLESGNVEVTGQFETDYYRVVMTAEQGGELERVEVATMLFDVAGGTVDYGTDVKSINGLSVLFPASVTAVTTGEYAPEGVDGALYAGELLESAINAPVEVEGSFILDDHIVFELGATVLDAAWTVLEAGNFVIQIDGEGIVHVMPKPTEPSLILDSTSSGLLENGITYTEDMSKIPNRYVVIDGTTVTVAENNSANSIVSTVSRGYRVDLIDTSPTPVDGKTMSEYANEKLAEASIMKSEKTYTREYAPNVYPYSIIRASIDGLDGDMRVESQSITCDTGISVNEKASIEVNLWTSE